MPNSITCRPAAVAGLFYPRDPATLGDEIRQLLSKARRPKLAGSLKGLIVPHAGYMYSGPVAASAYVLLEPLRKFIRRVVLVGPVHRVPIRGLALPPDRTFETPLGTIALDELAAGRLRALPQVSVNRAAHAMEHSIEVQLPFLQAVLDDFALVPLVVGDARTSEVAEALEKVWGGPETIIVASSDLSHYYSYSESRRIDQDTCDTITRLGPDLNHEQACGGTAINGLMKAAKSHSLSVRVLDLRNSGDTGGDRDRVVGYAAIALCGESGGR